MGQTGRIDGPARTLNPGRPLTPQIVDDLLERISHGEFSPGQKLPGEIELMAEYGVGRNTVREAIQGLVTLKLLDVRPRRGAIVLSVTPDRALPRETLVALLSPQVTDDLVSVRLLVETEAAGVAARRRDRARIGEIRELHDQMRQEVESGRLAEEFKLGGPAWETDLRVHDAITRASGNSVLVTVWQAVSDLLTAHRRESMVHMLENVGEFGEYPVIAEHEKIIVAIESGDEESARRLMAEHIRSAAAYSRPGAARN